MLDRQQYGRLVLITLSIVVAVSLVMLGLGRLFAPRGPNVAAHATATLGATASATASPTPSYSSGRPLSWSPVVFPSNAVSFALTPADENVSYACIPQTASSESGVGFWASHDCGATWTHVSDLPTHQAGQCTVVPDTLAVGIAIVDLEWYVPGASPLSPSQLSFATTDGGRSWTELASAFDYVQLASYRGATYAIRLDNPATLGGSERLVVSTDGLRSWQAVDRAMEDAHALPNAFWLNPANGSLLAYAFTVDANGANLTRSLWVSADAGGSWRRLSGPGNSMSFLAVQWPTNGGPWHLCTSDQDITALPDQQSNQLACTQDGGSTWVGRPALNIALTCKTCLKGHPYTPIATLTLAGIAPDGSLLATAADRFDSDGTAHLSLFRLAPDTTRWESLGEFPGADPNDTDVYPTPSGHLWLVGSPRFSTTYFNQASFTVSSGVYVATYP